MAEQGRPASFSPLPALNLARLQIEARPWLGFALPAAFAAVVALLAALHYVESPGIVRPPFDDSFISLQFARNLAEHGKLSFDGEEWSTGATSILHVAFLAALVKLGIEPIEAGIYFGVAGHVGLALAVFWLGWAVFRTVLAATAAAVIIALTNYAAFDAGNGMETSLFMALTAASMAAVLSLRTLAGRLLAGSLIALAILTRPEGVFLLPAAAVYLWLDREPAVDLRRLARDGAALLAPGVAVLALLSLFALAVTGELTPGTGTAKLEFFRDNTLAFKRKLQLAGDFMGLFWGPLFPTLFVAFFAPRRRGLLLLLLFWVPMVAAYAVMFPGGLSHYFYRYQHPVLPLLAVAAGGGVAFLVTEALRREWAVKALAAGAIVVLAVPLWHHFETWRVLYRDASFETLADLESMARDLNTIVRPDQTLATHDIGAVGYYADYKVLDLVGLVNPDVIPYHDDREVALYLNIARPDYLLIFAEWDAEFLHISPAEDPSRYELVKRYEGRSIRPFSYILYRVRYLTAP
jgi:hypothetical protein